jgi:hypothetical protein
MNKQLKDLLEKNLRLLIAAGIAVVIIAIVAIAHHRATNLNSQQTADTQSSSNPSSSDSTDDSSSSAPAATAPAPTPAPSPQHTIVYTFGVDKGQMTATDMQNVGLSWNDPTTDAHDIPPNILATVQQMASSGYSVTFSVAKVNKNNLYAGINNYNDPDATLSCTIMVDSQIVADQEAAPSGSADCFGSSN